MNAIRLVLLPVGMAAFCTLSLAVAEESPAKPEPKASAVPRIQLAVLLDTSNSMDGLINQARTQLWKIVNELATAQRNGQVPELQVALYEYGKPTLPQENGFVRQIVPLTDDLDKISEELFALTTNGGQEYCGAVIAAATKELKWSESDKDLKLIFIAGNEPFTQGEVSSKDACSTAIAKGITVNTIFCGPQAEGIRTGWQEGAKLADGTFLHIDQNSPVAQIKTPFDAKLAELSGAVSKTYIAFGKAEKRRAAADRQVEQDAAAANAAPAAAAERATFKASGLYMRAASTWDLIDALKDGKIKLEDIKDEELPENLRKLDLAERKEYVTTKETERTKLQADVRELSEKRAAYIADEQRKGAKTNPRDSFDAAMIQAIREQAANRQFELRDE